MVKRDIGDALDSLTNDVKLAVRDLTQQFRTHGLPNLLKQAVDTPHRARAQIAAWIASYNAANGAGTAQTFLASCLTAAGSSQTLASIDSALAALEAQALVLVNHVQNDGWTWEWVATAIESSISGTPKTQFSYALLPIPSGYQTVWGEPW